MHVATCLTFRHADQTLAFSYRLVPDGHATDADGRAPGSGSPRKAARR